MDTTNNFDVTKMHFFITGATGSFGQACVHRLLEMGAPRIACFSRDERKQEDMQRALAPLNPYDRLRFFVGDVRDYERVKQAMRGADIVIHAAALKIITKVDYDPEEALKTNVIGSRNVAMAALENDVWRVIGLSSDKACNACTSYGVTKRMMESLLCRANVYAGNRRTRLACVRYGNVLGSRGSVAHLFREQAAAGGPLTITDPRSTRFWITLERAVELVLSCLPVMQGGETFIPILPSMKITDLATAIAPGAEQRTIGLRSGEKLHEVLVSADEAPRTRRLAWDRYVILPADPTWPTDFSGAGEPVPEGFCYGSNGNSQLSIPEMRQMLEGVP